MSPRSVTRHGERGPVDVVHVLFGGLGGHAAVVRELTAQFRARGLRSAACLYAPPGTFLEKPLDRLGVDGAAEIEKRGRIDFEGACAINRVTTEYRAAAVLWHAHHAAEALGRVAAIDRDCPLLLVEHQPLHRRALGDQVRSLLGMVPASAVVFLSEDYRRGYPFRALPFSALRRAVVIPNGIDVQRFSPFARRGNRDGGINVGMMGRMDGSKDFGSCIAAAALWAASETRPRIRLFLAGAGPERQQLEQQASALGPADPVEFVGLLDPAGVISFLQSLDLYVHMSKGETHSTSLMQAYAAGLPVIASSVGGIRNQVRDGTDGILVPPHDVTRLVQKVRELAALPKERERLAAAARERAVNEFGSDLMADRYLDLLDSLHPEGPWSAAKTSGRPAADD